MFSMLISNKSTIVVPHVIVHDARTYVANAALIMNQVMHPLVGTLGIQILVGPIRGHHDAAHHFACAEANTTQEHAKQSNIRLIS